jgi:hypothetical protein
MAVSFERNACTARLANDEVELEASTAYGPRVMRYARVGGENVFGVVDPRAQAYPTPFGEAWHAYGGHRLWTAPEHPIRSYIPDNAPVAVRVENENTLVLTQSAEPMTALVKELGLTLGATGSRVVVEHRISNAGSFPATLAPWALSLMAPGGVAIFPNPPFAPHPEALLPAARLVTWPYTWLGDPRLRFGRRHLRVRHDPAARDPQKLGLHDMHHGWAAYACAQGVFVTRYALLDPAARLPDLGCNVETFTGPAFLELETLGALVTLAPGETASHVETWSLAPPIALPDDEDEAARLLAPIAHAS